MFYDDQLAPTIDKMNKFMRFDWKDIREEHVLDSVMLKVGSLLAEPHYDFDADQMIVGAMWSVIHAWYASASTARSLSPFRSKIKELQEMTNTIKIKVQSLKLALLSERRQ